MLLSISDCSLFPATENEDCTLFIVGYVLIFHLYSTFNILHMHVFRRIYYQLFLINKRELK